MSEEINHHRRRFFGTSAMTIAAIAGASVAASKSWLAFIGAPIEALAGDKSVVQQMTPAAVRLPIEGELPSLGSATEWLNSPPLTAAGLRGKVVLVYFWTLYLHQLATLTALCPRLGREIQESRIGGDRSARA